MLPKHLVKKCVQREWRSFLPKSKYIVPTTRLTKTNKHFSHLRRLRRDVDSPKDTAEPTLCLNMKPAKCQDVGQASLALAPWERWLYPLFLCLVHWILNLAAALWLHLDHLRRSRGGTAPQPDALGLFSAQCQARLTKRPEHVAFALLEPLTEAPLVEAGRFVVWAIASGANAVSLYDPSGILKRSHIRLVSEIRGALSVAFGNEEDSFWKHIRLQWRPHLQTEADGLGPLPGRNGSSNGDTQQQRVVHISILSASDGCQDLVSAAQTLAGQVATGQLDVGSINEDLISATLRTNKGMLDPTILIRLGQSHSNMGFLPWQTRLMEIYDFPSLYFYSSEDYFNHLLKFSKCEQRYGR